MFEFREIGIDDRVIFHKYLRENNYKSSEMTFTNFFMWRNYYKFRFLEYKNFLCIISKQDNTEPFAFIPIGSPGKEGFEEVVLLLYEYFRENNWKLIFKRVEEEKLHYFTEALSLPVETVFDRDSSDYVYSSEDLISLKGKKFHGKRNHINSFKLQYEYEYVELKKELVSECIRINKEWCEQRSSDSHKEFFYETEANIELLNNFEILGCKGALVKIDGRFEGFTVGERLNEDTAVIHIEKANGDIRGIYTFINQQFCENAWKDLAYINREQDLGIEGLRKAKLSYNPVKMTNKYYVYVK